MPHTAWAIRKSGEAKSLKIISVQPKSARWPKLQKALCQLMKQAKLVTGIIFASYIFAGCTHLNATKVPTGEQMKGTWTGTSSGQENSKSSESDVTFLIDQALGQNFSGTIKYKYKDGRPGQEPIHGSIGKNGNIAMADKDGFYINGLLDNNRLSLQYIEASPKESVALNMYLQKQ